LHALSTCAIRIEPGISKGTGQARINLKKRARAIAIFYPQIKWLSDPVERIQPGDHFYKQQAIKG
jgi:hypothetical protein